MSGENAPSGIMALHFEGPTSFFLRLTIARKMALGFMSLLALLLLISVFALASLNKLNNINYSILLVDVPIADAAGKMKDIVLDQEAYAKRYAILEETPELLKIFWERSAEFDELLDGISMMPAETPLPVDRLDAMHSDYNDLLMRGLESLKDPSSTEAENFEKRIKKQQEAIVALLKRMSNNATASRDRKTEVTTSIGRTAFRVAGVLCLMGFILSLLASMVITRNISGSIRKLKLATEKISEGNFDYEPDIRNKDELGDLSNAFISMGKRLKRLEEMYLDASPLTRLPGGVAIENLLKKRLETNTPFAFCMMDVDNFKGYNDQYGYSRGNEVIQMTAEIIEQSVREFGSEDDFIGHIGGDDFALITSLEHYADICRSVISRFDEMILGFYDDIDRKRGYVSGRNRQGVEVRHPIATLSIAVVTTIVGGIENHIQVGEIAAELKQYAKGLSGSNYVVDKRRARRRPSKGGETVVEFPVKRKTDRIES